MSVKTNKHELVTTGEGGMLSLIEKALINPEVDVLKMEQMLNVQERIYDKNAQIEFNRAMSECQKDMPAVAKKALNNQTNSKYAKYESIIIDTKPCYTRHGFSISFHEGLSDKEGHIRVDADLMHAHGHAKAYHIDLPRDSVGIKGSVNKTGVHAAGSTFSYAKRYLFCMIFNIPLADEDDDATKAGNITIEELLEYNATVRELFDNVSDIKGAFANNDFQAAAMSWLDMSEQQRNALWKAPTKGGIFTTNEIKIFRSEDFSTACKAIVVAPSAKSDAE